jgi:mannose-6-phosphate isomerase-like protein (cupin superfamily)
MRHFASASADSYTIGSVDVARWDQYSLQDTLPFEAMWYRISPGESSPMDCHPEIELSIVINGTASVEAGGEITEAASGSAFLLDSEEAHVIHNRSAQELLIFTTYWMPLRPPTQKVVGAEAVTEEAVP